MGPADKTRAPSSGNKPAMNHNNSKAKGPNGSAISNIHRERLLHLSLTLIGQKVVATLTDGAVLEGIFHTFTPFAGLEADVKNKYVLNAVKVVKPGKGDEIKAGSTVILAVEKVAQIYAKNINLDRPNQNGGAKGGKGDFVTDTQISASKGAGGKDLVAAGSAWTTAPPPSSGGSKPASRADALAGALGASKTSDTSGLKGSIGKWDQFKANEELFNVNASFDENLYTTELDKTQIDQRKIAEAERIAKEIEGTASTNIHIAEERGQAVETDYDEEDRYSGVLTKDGKQRHEAAEKAKAAPKMNYAAAAAKADATKKAAAKASTPTSSDSPKPADPTKTVTEKTDPPKEAKPEEKDAPKESAPAPAPAAKETEKKEEAKEESPKEENKPEEKKETKAVTKTSKLNANAKEFTFNPAAKSFTPSFGAGGGGFGGPQPQQQPQHMDPNMQMHGGHPMHPPHYMPPQMGQPGMMPMMNPQYPGMRYPPQYPGMDQQGGPPMQQPPQSGNTQASSTGTTPPTSQGAPTPPAGGEGDSSAAPSQDGESSQPSAPQSQGPQSQQHPSQQQPQQMPMPYNVPQGYFPGGAMPMHPRGPGGYPPQFVGGPQQMPVGPQGAPYGRQMYPMQPGGMPPAMMRGPNGAPYYAGPNGPMPYPPGAYGMMDDGDGYRGRGGRGQGRGRGRGRGAGRGRGRGHYQQHPQQYGGHGSGRSTPQQGVPDQTGGAAPPQQGQPGEKPNEGGTPDASS